MKIIMDRKARIYLKEKTAALAEFGSCQVACIKELKPIWVPAEIREFYEGESNTRVLVVEDTYGLEFNIPFNAVEDIRYF